MSKRSAGIEEGLPIEVRAVTRARSDERAPVRPRADTPPPETAEPAPVGERDSRPANRYAIEQQRLQRGETSKPADPETIPEDAVWISCRAKNSCKGNYAVVIERQIVHEINILPGTRNIRYRCLSCGVVFHVHH